MKYYLLAMHQPVGDPPPPEILEPIMRDLAAVEEEMKAAGVWVFAETEDPQTALALVEALDLNGYHVYHAIRAALLRRLGRTAEAAEAYDQAAARTSNAAEQAYLRDARDALARPADPG